MSAQIEFLGAAEEVTGSCYRIEAGGARFLIDCGMFQGGRDAERKNRNTFDFDPRGIDFVLLSHAHIDHSGLLPRLVAQGFKGPVYATPATVDLAAVMLPDSAYIQEREVQQADLRRRRARGRIGRETAPLYTVAQAQATLARMRPIAYDTVFQPAKHVRCRFRNAGHILGSAILEIELLDAGGHRLVFSGDLGQPGHPIVEDPARVAQADTLLIESTYGNRCHKGLAETLEELTTAIRDTLERKHGNIIVPAFAVGRTQDILFLLAKLAREGRLPHLDIYVDSPMALAATEVTVKHAGLIDAEGRTVLEWLRREHPGFRLSFVRDVEDSKRLNALRSGAIIVSASGMCDAGRIKHHLRHNLARHECTVLITGFQAAGTLGRRLVDRAARVRIFGEEVPVNADIFTIGGLSAHADQEALLGWARGFERAPRRVFVVHGEPMAAHALRAELVQRLGWTVDVARPNLRVALAD